MNIGDRLEDILSRLVPLRDLIDAMGEWEPDAEDVDHELERIELDPIDVPTFVPEVVDLEDEAARVRYPDTRNKAGQVTKRGRIKRTRFAPRDLKSIKLLGIHQMGAEKSVESQRYKYVSAQRVTRADGARLFLHPLECRTITGNAMDRAPFHGVHIEVAGNFEGIDGSGDWYKPEVFGAGRASTRQLIGLAWEITGIHLELVEAGGGLELVAPHRVSGRNSAGKPNRPICPGSRVWQAAELVTLAMGLDVPDDGWTIGGMPIPVSWRSAAYWELRGESPPPEWAPAVSDEERGLLEAVARGRAA